MMVLDAGNCSARVQEGARASLHRLSHRKTTAQKQIFQNQSPSWPGQDRWQSCHLAKFLLDWNANCLATIFGSEGNTALSGTEDAPMTVSVILL